MEIKKDQQLASVLDKTDWKDEIQKFLTKMIESKGTLGYSRSVEKAKQALAITFPNWDAYTEINTKVNEIKKKYFLEFVTWVTIHRRDWEYLEQCEIKRWEFIEKRDNEINIYLDNIAGERRMLLYGSKTQRSGTPLKKPGTNEDDMV